MKKSELKRVLKPLIQECVKEVMLEEGVLSGIIAEVARGIKATPPMVVSPAPVDPMTERMKRNAFSGAQSNKLKEHKKKLLEAIGGDTFNGVDLFEGTIPAAAERSSEQQTLPLSDQEPQDPGVDISSLFGSVGGHWNAHMSDVRSEK